MSEKNDVLLHPLVPLCAAAIASGALLAAVLWNLFIIRTSAIALLPAVLAHAVAVVPQPLTLARFAPGAVALPYAVSMILVALGIRAHDGFVSGVLAVEAVSGALGVGALAALAGRLFRWKYGHRAYPLLAGLPLVYGAGAAWTTWFNGGALPLAIGSTAFTGILTAAFVRPAPNAERTVSRDRDGSPLSFDRAARGIAHALVKPVALADEQLMEIARRMEDGDLRRDVQSSARVIGQVKRFVRDLVDLARAGEHSESRRVRLASVIDQALADINTRYLHAFLTVELEDLTLALPEVELRCLVINLIENAIEAGERGSPVWVRCERKGSWANITVEDFAGGFQGSVCDQLFEPFFTTKPHGTGLGLAIVQEICRVHGGRVSAAPTKTGTVFTVTLPLNAG